MTQRIEPYVFGRWMPHDLVPARDDSPLRPIIGNATAAPCWMLPQHVVNKLDDVHELIAMQLDVPSISAHALQQWSEAVITASLMARMTATGDVEMGEICDHLQQLINRRQADGSLMLTDADRQQIAHAVDVMTAVASITPEEIARQCASTCQAAMESGRLPEMLRRSGGGR